LNTAVDGCEIRLQLPPAYGTPWRRGRRALVGRLGAMTQLSPASLEAVSKDDISSKHISVSSRRTSLT